MKKLLLLLIASMVTALAVPAARAFDKDPWHDTEKTLDQLYIRMDAVKEKRDRMGAGPELRDEIAELHDGLVDLTDRVKHQAGDPKVARKKADNLSDLMSRVEAEYRSRAHHHEGVVVRVYPG